MEVWPSLALTSLMCHGEQNQSLVTLKRTSVLQAEHDICMRSMEILQTGKFKG